MDSWASVQILPLSRHQSSITLPQSTLACVHAPFHTSTPHSEAYHCPIHTGIVGRVGQCHTYASHVSTFLDGRSWFMTSAKALYYNTFALVYGAAGGCAHATLVNSSWTQRHIESLWWGGRPIYRVYPPCDTQDLQTLPLD
eukprot:scaffold130432_cov24-Tisochrysis_lutea.AAC.1